MGPRRATGSLRLFARLAQAFHEHASIELLGRVLVVGATGETDAIDVVQVRLRKPVDVVELEPARLAASPAVLGDKSASAFVPHVHLALDRSRSVRRRRKNRLHGLVSPRLPAHAEALLQQIRNECIERFLEDDGEIPIGNAVPEEILRLPQLVANFARPGELELL